MMGSALVTAATALPDRALLVHVVYLVAIVVGYSGVAACGWFLARRGWAGVATTVAAVVYVCVPRLVMMPTEATNDAYNEKPLAVLAMALLGLGLGIAHSRRERILVLLPAALVWSSAVLVPDHLLNPAMTWLSASGAIFLLGRHWDAAARRVVLPLLLVAGVASIALLIPGVGAPNAIQYEGLGRPYGIFGNPIVASTCVVLLGAAVAASWWHRTWVVVVTSVGALAGVVLTGSKTGMLLLLLLVAAAVLGFFPGAVQPPRWKRGLAVIVGAGALALAMMPLLEKVFGRAVTVDLSSVSVKARVAGWGEGLAELAARPLGGDRILLDIGAEDLRSFENLFFDLGTRLGWLALAGLLVAWALIWVNGASGARVAVLLSLAAGMTAATYYQPSVMVLGFLLMGILDAVGRGESRDATSEEADSVPDILHVIPTLHIGGAERLLCSVAIDQRRRGHDVTVLTLEAGTSFGDMLRDADVRVVDLKAFGRGRLLGAVGLLRLVLLVATARQHSVVGWLYHGSLAATLVPRATTVRVASIHHRDPTDPGVKRSTRAVFSLLARRSARLTHAVYVSAGSRDAHVDAGLEVSALVVPVGVDTDGFDVARTTARNQARAQLGIAPQAPAVAHVARVHPDKGQEVLLAAFAELRRTCTDAVLVVGGSGWEPGEGVDALLAQSGVRADGVLMLGQISDPRPVYAAADIFCLSSHTEALPVALIEAMASGLTPVVTAVGGCPDAAGDLGVVVPAGDHHALAAGLRQGLERAAGGEAVAAAVRGRAVENYGERAMFDGYASLFE